MTCFVDTIHTSIFGILTEVTQKNEPALYAETHLTFTEGLHWFGGKAQYEAFTYRHIFFITSNCLFAENKKVFC